MKKFITYMLSAIFIISTLIIKTNDIYADDLDEEVETSIDVERLSIEANNKIEKEPVVNSKNVAIYDRASKTIIYGKNENQKVPMASTTKIMTAIVLVEELNKNNNISLEDEIEVCKEAAHIGGSRLGLHIGDKIKLNDLLYGLMLKSRK